MTSSPRKQNLILLYQSNKINVDNRTQRIACWMDGVLVVHGRDLVLMAGASIAEQQQTKHRTKYKPMQGTRHKATWTHQTKQKPGEKRPGGYNSSVHTIILLFDSTWSQPTRRKERKGNVTRIAIKIVSTVHYVAENTALPQLQAFRALVHRCRHHQQDNPRPLSPRCCRQNRDGAVDTTGKPHQHAQAARLHVLTGYQ